MAQTSKARETVKKKVAPCPGLNLTEYDDFGLLSVTVVFLMLKVVNGHN